MNTAAPLSTFRFRKLMSTLFAAQSLASLGMTAALTVGSLAAVNLTHDSALSGLPTTLALLGSALGAYPAGRFMDRFGRREVIVLGFIVAALGALLAVAAFAIQNLLLLLVGFALLGLGRSTTDLGRFAAADLVPSSGRARAVSWFVLGGTVGGIGGPLVIGPAGRFAAGFNFDPLAGPFMVAVLLALIGSVLVFALLRPDPLEIARRIEANANSLNPAPSLTRPLSAILAAPSVQLAVAAMVIGQLVMVAVMVMTPLHMSQHHHSLDEISLVIAAHVIGMYGLSVVTGRIADVFGHGRAIMLGGLLLITACLLAPFADSTLRLAAALFLLGFGWNMAYVSGSSLLADSLRPSERGRAQGANDLLVGLTAALGSLGSGFAFATVGYLGLGLAGIALSLLLLTFTTWTARQLVRPAIQP